MHHVDRQGCPDTICMHSPCTFRRIVCLLPFVLQHDPGKHANLLLFAAPLIFLGYVLVRIQERYIVYLSDRCMSIGRVPDISIYFPKVWP